MEGFLKKKGIQTLKKIELMSNEAVKQAIMAGLGYSIMPMYGIKNELKNGQLAIIPFDGLPIKTSWKLIWHKEKSPSPVAKAFLNYVKEEKDAIRQKHFE